MSSAHRPGSRRLLLAASALLSPAFILVAPDGSLFAPAPAYAQTPTAVPPVLVETSKPKPRVRRARSTAPSTAPQESRAPASAAAEAPGPQGPSVPASSAAFVSGDIAGRSLGTSDSAALVDAIPGGASWGAGGVSSLPALNGMGADRVQVAINSMLISPACPNEMNPPLSFVNPAMIANMRAYLGVAPVSAGGDYTGGKIVIDTAPPKFAAADKGWLSSVTLSGFFRSVNNSYGVDAAATVANRDTSVTYTGGWVRAGNYTAGNGMVVKSTQYETQNHALSISRQTFGNLFTVQVGGQFIPFQAYVNQYMDMVYNRGAFLNGRYEGAFDWGRFEATAFVHDVRHTMGFITPDKTGQMPMDTRASDAGYTLKATLAASPRDAVRIGNELHHNRLSDWWDPVGMGMMCCNVFWNINDGTRTRLGTFAEWEHKWNREWTTLLGLRNDVVWMNTGDVQAYNTNMMMYGADAAVFNASSRARTDVNVDGTALVRYEPGPGSLFELGLARKTRSPNMYERYAWSTNTMAMRMIGWFGDGNGYVGNLDLRPEKAHTASFTAGWSDPVRKNWELKVTPYYTYVQDYIDADKCVSPGMGGMRANCNAVGTATNSYVFLRFANHDAYLYGANLAAMVALWDNPVYGRGVFRGTLAYVRGQRTDGVNLYHVMPINSKLALDHTLGNWTNTVEVQLVGSKDDVSSVRNELPTAAYALVNVRTGYQWSAARIDVGIDNLFNQAYDLPLGGADLADHWHLMGMMKVYDYGFNVPGPGRSFNGRLTVKF